jgi:hypothetical protein
MEEPAAAYFKRVRPEAPVVVLLRQQDEPVQAADYNCPADSPPEWIRSLGTALGGVT